VEQPVLAAASASQAKPSRHKHHTLASLAVVLKGRRLYWQFQPKEDDTAIDSEEFANLVLESLINGQTVEDGQLACNQPQDLTATAAPVASAAAAAAASDAPAAIVSLPVLPGSITTTGQLQELIFDFCNGLPATNSTDEMKWPATCPICGFRPTGLLRPDKGTNHMKSCEKFKAARVAVAKVKKQDVKVGKDIQNIFVVQKETESQP
jgi:hypothetical protein